MPFSKRSHPKQAPDPAGGETQLEWRTAVSRGPAELTRPSVVPQQGRRGVPRAQPGGRQQGGRMDRPGL